MLIVELATLETYNEDTNEFIYEGGGTVRFEYSLKAVYDWEFKWRKPFLKGGLNEEELIDFYICMALDPVDQKYITGEVAYKLSSYISDKGTATTFTSTDSENGGPNRSKLYTAEELYALMSLENIPIEFENRNLNRLLTILRVITSYKTPPKKMSKDDIYKQNVELNKARREQMKTKG